jgi:hypothetical protein
LLYYGAIVPFALMILFNFLIIYKATQFSSGSKKPSTLDEIKRAKRRNEMIKTIVVLTLSYVIVELPCFIFNGYFYSTVIVLDVGTMINALFNNIEFSFPALNFFILYASNKMFAKELKKLLKCGRARSKRPQSANMRATQTN